VGSRKLVRRQKSDGEKRGGGGGQVVLTRFPLDGCKSKASPQKSKIKSGENGAENARIYACFETLKKLLKELWLCEYACMPPKLMTEHIKTPLQATFFLNQPTHDSAHGP